MTVSLAIFTAVGALAGGDEVILKTGTLDSYDRTGPIVYHQYITLAQNPELAKREDGEVRLTGDPNDTENVLLAFHQGTASRRIGSFPQSVGNPLFMYFIETVIRDMANFAGGSPFYIRNRMKNALVNGADVIEEAGQGYGLASPVTLARMVPFENDPNRDRMDGFEDLEIRIAMSDHATGYFLSLDATARAKGKVVYRRLLELQP